jgi:hypothetical protein
MSSTQDKQLSDQEDGDEQVQLSGIGIAFLHAASVVGENASPDPAARFVLDYEHEHLRTEHADAPPSVDPLPADGLLDLDRQTVEGAVANLDLERETIDGLSAQDIYCAWRVFREHTPGREPQLIDLIARLDRDESTDVVFYICGGDPSQIPERGGPGFFVSHDQEGNLIEATYVR